MLITLNMQSTLLEMLGVQHCIVNHRIYAMWISRTYYLYNWNFVPFDHPFSISPTP